MFYDYLYDIKKFQKVQAFEKEREFDGLTKGVEEKKHAKGKKSSEGSNEIYEDGSPDKRRSQVVKILLQMTKSLRCFLSTFRTNKVCRQI